MEISYKKMVTFINQNFVIRYQYNDDKRTSLIGAGKLWVLFDCKKLALRYFNEAIESQGQNYTIKLRRGLRIDFVGK